MCRIFGSIEPIVTLRCVSEALVVFLTLPRRYSCRLSRYRIQNMSGVNCISPGGILLLTRSVGLRWHGSWTQHHGLCTLVSLLSILYQCFASTGIACVGFPDSSWPGAVMAEGNHHGAIEDCCLALWVREPGDTQWDRNLPECLLSQVFEGEGDMETGEKKCQGPKLVQVTVCLGKATERQ